MPKDDNLTPRFGGAPSPGFLRRIFGGVFGAGRRRGDLPGMHEEMFRIRGELALARAELEQIRTAVGRRDIATLEELLRAGNRREIEALIRDRTQTVAMPDGTVLCRVLGRFKFFVDAADVAVAPHLLLDGYWEYWITEFLCRNIGRAETVIDIGAFYGYYTVMMADLVGPQGRVVAFEPNPWLHSIAARNLSINGRDPGLSLHRSAVASADGETRRLRAALTGPRKGAFGGWFEEAEGGRQVFSASTVTLDAIEPGRADFIRVAPAGAVEGVWTGMQGVLSRSPGIRLLLRWEAPACQDAAGFLAEVEKAFPLRFVDGDARAKLCTVEDLLTKRTHTTLYLSRAEPR